MTKYKFTSLMLVLSLLLVACGSSNETSTCLLYTSDAADE